MIWIKAIYLSIYLSIYLLETAHKEIGVRADVNCEDLSLSNPSDKKLAEERSSKPQSHPSYFVIT